MASPDSSSVQVALNRANPNTLADHARLLKLGDVLSAHVPQQLRKVNPAANANQLATVESCGLPLHRRAESIVRATARAATTGALGALAVQAPNTTPADGQIAIAPNGDIVTLASVIYTDLDVTYIPVDGEVVVLPELPAPLGILTIPTKYSDRGVIYLLAATAVTATNAGAKIILAPATGVVATTKAALAVDGTKVYFNYATDVVTSAIVTLLVVPTSQLHTTLDSTALTV